MESSWGFFTPNLLRAVMRDKQLIHALVQQQRVLGVLVGVCLLQTATLPKLAESETATCSARICIGFSLSVKIYTNTIDSHCLSSF